MEDLTAILPGGSDRRARDQGPDSVLNLTVRPILSLQCAATTRRFPRRGPRSRSPWRGIRGRYWQDMKLLLPEKF